MVIHSQDSKQHIGVVSSNQSIITKIQSITPILKLDPKSQVDIDKSLGIIFIDDAIDNLETYITEASSLNIPLILLVDLETSSLPQLLEQGISDYIPKPIHTALLEHRLIQFQNQLIQTDIQLDEISMITLMTDENLIITHWSKFAEDFYGWRAEDVIGQHLTGLVPTIYVNSERQQAVDDLDKGHVWRGELIQSTKYGDTCHVITTISRIFQDGGIINHLFVIHEITSQTIEFALQQSDHHMEVTYRNTEHQTILSSMTDPVFVFDKEGTYLRIPENQSENFYEPPSNLYGNRIVDIFPKDIADRFMQVINRAIESRSTQYLEYDLPIRNGRTYFSAVVNTIADRDEVVWVARDVTRAKLNELALIETEKRYRQLFEHANDMILIIDMQSGQIIDGNRQVLKQLGYTYKELIQQNVTQIELPVQDAQSRIINRTLETSGQIIIEQTYRHKDGTIIPVEVSSRITTHHNRKVLLSFARNIKQRKSALQAEAEERYFAEALRDTISRLASTLTMDDVFDVMISTAIKTIDSESINIMLVENDEAYIIRIEGYHEHIKSNNRILITSVFTLRTMQETQQALVISDTENDARWVVFDERNWTKSYVASPIVLKGETIGFINLGSSVPNHFTNKHRQRLQAFANQSAIALQNAKLYEVNLRHMQNLELRVTERTRELTQANEELTKQMSKRIEAEEKLAKERNILQTIIKNLPDTVYIKDRQSRFTLVNKFPYLIYQEQPIIGKSDFDFIEDKAIAQDRYEEEQALMESGDTFSIEEYVVTESGDEHWIIRTKIPFYDEQGEVAGLIGVNQDVTQIKMAERQLRQLLANAKCLLWYAIIIYDGTTYHWTTTIENEDSASSFLPFDTSQSSYTQAWLESIPTDKQTLRESVARAHIQQNKANYTIEYHCVTSDGKTHWLNEDVRIQNLTDNRWHLVGVSLDISDIKSAEFALRESHHQMEQRVIERTTDLRHEIQIRQQAEAAERTQRVLAEALQDSITAMNSTLNIEGILDTLLDAIQLVVEHTASNVMLLQNDHWEIVRQRGYNYQVPNIPIGMFKDIDLMRETRQPYLIPDTELDPLWETFEPSIWIKSSIKLPILFDDEVIGVIILDSINLNQFTIEHSKVLQTFANQASIALKNANLYQQAQAEIIERKRAEAAEREQRQFAEALRETAILLNQQLSVSELFETIIETIGTIIKVQDSVSIIVMSKDGTRGTVVQDKGFESHGGSVTGLELDFSDNSSKQRLIQEHQTILITDTQASEFWVHHPNTAWIRSHISIPVYVPDKVLALITLDSQHPNTFTQEQVDKLLIYTHQVAIALQNAELIEQIQTSNQKLESRVQQRTEELELERSLLRAILDAMRDGVYYSYTHNKPVYINNALSDITGYPPEEWLSGEVFDHINTTKRIDRERLWQEVSAHLQHQQFWHDEARLIRADGTEFDASLIRTQVYGLDGKPQGIVTVIRDISLHKQLEEQKARFIANAAHELRTPITNIKTRLYLMKHKPDQLQEHMTIAESATNWMQSLVDNLFEHSRFERGIIQLNIEEFILQDLLSIICITQQPEAEYKNIHLITDWQTIPILINADTSRLRQVITNLINNAINYTPNDGMITVKAHEEILNKIPTAIISISDTGVGISQTHLPYLFQPFYRATDDSKGAGLGLSIAREIVEIHKGSIHVDSTVGKGTTFYINLPLHIDDSDLKDE